MTVAALYVDPRGPYPQLAGVDCWTEDRDARLYPGPYPIIAHPPCGPWGQLAHLCKYQDATLAPLAVEQLIRWGGVLEHPVNSRLWAEFALPLPGGLPQVRDGRTLWAITVDQVRWGHRCRKTTTLLFADVPFNAVRAMPPPREATHVITNYAGRNTGTKLKASAEICRRTPPAFAAWLVSLARKVSGIEEAA